MPKILVIENNEMNRDMLSRRLQRRGYEVIFSVDGEDGVARAQSDAPDIILMDMDLPVLDGWAATRILKSSPQTRTIPVIALTAHAMAGDRERALEAGCDALEAVRLSCSWGCCPLTRGRAETGLVMAGGGRAGGRAQVLWSSCSLVFTILLIWSMNESVSF